MKRLIILISFLTFIANIGWAAGDLNLMDQKIKTSYSVGYQVGGDFERQGMEINPEILMKGIQDALSGTEPAMSDQEMRQILIDLQKRVEAEEKEEKLALAEKNRTEGKSFLEGNAMKEGVVALPSGLQYKVITEGEGTSPRAIDSVTVHYRGTLIDGTEFDSSYKRGNPATFKLNQVIKGWAEGLQLMKPGAKHRLFVPPELAYGSRGAGSMIGPNSTLIFEVELLSVEGG